MIRSMMTLAAFILMSTVFPQSLNINYSLYVGKYEINGFVVQIVANDNGLSLAVMGAPLQPLIPVERHKFKSAAFNDEYFLFVEKDGKIVSMVSQRKDQSTEFTRTSDIPDNFNGNDALLAGIKKTSHFLFRFSLVDSSNVNKIAETLEKEYPRVINDFRMKSLPVTTVRIYPTADSFHQGINFPNAPPNVMATAFGKDDFRMMSPRLVSTSGNDELTRHVLHEFTHCIHLNISYSPNNPRWLWEGVAMYESGWFVDPKDIDVIKNKQNLSFTSLHNGLEYEMGYVIIEAIKDIWGFDVVVELIKNKGDVQTVLKMDQTEFEKRVYERVYKKYVE